MSIAMTLLRRLGLFARRGVPADGRYDQRLQRLGMRETSRPLRKGIFRNWGGPPAA